jgi:hypothetical protein
MPGAPTSPQDGRPEPRAVPACALDHEGLKAQRERYARVAHSVRASVRAERALEVSFERDASWSALREALAVERECCPFLRVDLDEAGARLRVSVQRDEHLPALSALAHALAGELRRRT